MRLDTVVQSLLPGKDLVQRPGHLSTPFKLDRSSDRRDLLAYALARLHDVCTIPLNRQKLPLATPRT